MKRECYLCGKEIRGKAYRFFDKAFNEYIYICSGECLEKIDQIVEEESEETFSVTQKHHHHEHETFS